MANITIGTAADMLTQHSAMFKPQIQQKLRQDLEFEGQLIDDGDISWVSCEASSDSKRETTSQTLSSEGSASI